MLCSIVVPCYNEEKNIPLIFERFKAAMGGCRADLELLLVNNGSDDGTGERISALLSGHPFARMVVVAVNQGYGYGILQGLRAAKGGYLGWTHADLQTDPGDVIKAVNIVSEKRGRVFVKGDRKGRPLFDRFFTSGMSWFETLYLGERLHDINAQPNIFPAEFFRSWRNPPHDFALDLYALYMAKKHGLEVVRFDVKFPPRLHGASSWNTGLTAKWKFIKRTLDFSFVLKKQGIS
ncbi:MAG: glycosyltransferase family 2 protein [Deltaproteobacteria bacterium]|nr:glycosyltransferase family 2 protein [Deltaproteobacteria bacterium]